METLQRHAAETAFGAQNQHVLNSMAAAERCVRQLVERGFTVHTVEVRYSQPIVWIAPDVRCAGLGGVARIERARQGTQFSVMTATVEGCQVQWIGN